MGSSAAPPIIIAGAGIGGLTAALALAARGVASQVFERAAELREVGAGLQLAPNAFRIFQALGLDQAMEAISFSPGALCLFDSVTGKALSRQTLGADFDRRFGRPYRVAYRADVQKVLLDAVRRSDDLIDLRLGEALQDFEQNRLGVRVALEGGGESTGTALIGADGLWSTVRDQLFGPAKPRLTGDMAYRAVIPAQALPEGLATNDVQVWIGPGHHLVCYRLRGGELFNLVAIFEADEPLSGWNNLGDPARLHRAFESACPQVTQLLQSPPSWTAWTLYDRDPSPGWSQGRITLLGDAAHPMLPYLAQGACMAIEDAACIAEQINAHPHAIDAALQAYEQARFERTASVQLAAREVGAANHATGSAREQRNATIARNQPDDYEAIAWLYEGDGPRPREAAGSGVFGRFAQTKEA